MYVCMRAAVCNDEVKFAHMGGILDDFQNLMQFTAVRSKATECKYGLYRSVR